MNEEVDIQEMAQYIMERGPHRVLINSAGEARPSRIAREHHDIHPTIIFLRDDGWSLAAPAEFEATAYNMWKDKWVGFIRKPENFAQPIDEYVDREMAGTVN